MKSSVGRRLILAFLLVLGLASFSGVLATALGSWANHSASEVTHIGMARLDAMRAAEASLSQALSATKQHLLSKRDLGPIEVSVDAELARFEVMLHALRFGSESAEFLEHFPGAQLEASIPSAIDRDSVAQLDEIIAQVPTLRDPIRQVLAGSGRSCRTERALVRCRRQRPQYTRLPSYDRVGPF